jgi:hypothetical protein
MSDLTFAALRVANVVRYEQTTAALEELAPTEWATQVSAAAGDVAQAVLRLRGATDYSQMLLKLRDDPEGFGRPAMAEYRLALQEALADLVLAADLLAARLEIPLGIAIVERFNRQSHLAGSRVRLTPELGRSE